MQQNQSVMDCLPDNLVRIYTNHLLTNKHVSIKKYLARIFKKYEVYKIVSLLVKIVIHLVYCQLIDSISKISYHFDIKNIIMIDFICLLSKL